MSRNLKILDCTLRDSGYINNWGFSQPQIFKIVKPLEASNVDIIDLEREPFAMDKVYLHVSACENSQCAPLVRIPDKSDWIVLQALDQSAHGVVVPHIESVDNAKTFVDTQQDLEFFRKKMVTDKISAQYL